MSKHTQLFYRAVARIRAVNEKNGVIYIHRISTMVYTGLYKASKLKEELIKERVLRGWNENDLTKQAKGEKGSGNFIWQNPSKL